MTINHKEIMKLAELARIQLNEETIKETTKSITDVLCLIDQLGAEKTNDIQPMAHPTDAFQRLRADEVTESDQRQTFQDLAPLAENGLYLVPKVID